MSFPAVGLNQLYSWVQPNDIYGLSLALDRNAIVYDLSGELMSSADTTGGALGYRREYLVAAGVQGCNNSFIMGGNISDTANPTYQTSAVTNSGNSIPNAYNYINKQSNPLSDYTSIQTADNLNILMRDPVNQLPFDIKGETILVNPTRKAQVQTILRAMQVMNLTGTPTGSGSTVPPQWTLAGNPIQLPTPKMSNIWNKVLTDSTGLGGGGISQANATQYWFYGEPKKAFVWRQAWDLRTDQANPTSAEMLQKNIVNMWVSQWSGQFGIRDARWFQLNTN